MSEFVKVGRMSSAEERIAANTKRIERLEKDGEALNRLAVSVEVIANEQKNMSGKLASVDKKISELERMPRDRLNSIVGYILAALITAAVSLLISKFVF